MVLKRWLVGGPLKTAQAAHERLSKRLALAVFSSDALSSVAYATEEILLIFAVTLHQQNFFSVAEQYGDVHQHLAPLLTQLIHLAERAIHRCKNLIACRVR